MLMIQSKSNSLDKKI